MPSESEALEITIQENGVLTGRRVKIGREKRPAQAPRLVTTVLRRQAKTDPEAKLALAVIEAAVSDLHSPIPRKPRHGWGMNAYVRALNERQDARDFFCDGRLEVFAELCGLNADFVRRCLVEAGLAEKREVDVTRFRLNDFLERLERGGNIRRAAKEAGISRRLVYKRAEGDRRFRRRFRKALKRFSGGSQARQIS